MTRLLSGESLIGDARLREQARRMRPDDDPADVLARAAWSVLTEPGDVIAGALIGALGAVDALEFALSEDGLRTTLEGVGPKDLNEALVRWRPRAEPRAILDALRAADEVRAQMLLPGDPEWPQGFADLGAHAPVMLWVRGDVSHLAAACSVSIVGARAATGYGENVAAELSGDLAASGTLVVSGGAYGIDGAAHRAALGVGGATVAFLAGGVDRLYPAGHQQLFERIISRGALVSELPCGAAPTKWRFLQRNRLIAAMSQATVVVEAGWRSGTLNTAGHAAALGRPIGAVPGPVTSAASAGCHRLLREYDAICVTTAAEVRELWGEPAGMSAAERPDPDRTRLIDALSSRAAREPAELARRSGLSIERVRGLLGILDLEGIVMRRGAGWLLIG